MFALERDLMLEIFSPLAQRHRMKFMLGLMAE